MNAKMKRRLIVVTGAIVIVIILVFAVVAGNSAAKTVSVAEAIEMQGDGKIQVTGNVAENSFTIDGDVLTFKIYDPEADPAASQLLDVRYDGGVSATFGNEVSAICTGKKDETGVLNCSELVTKCPSKYESGVDALSVASLIGYGDRVVDKPVKVVGIVKDGTLAGVDASERFTIADAELNYELPVVFGGALSEDVVGGSSVVLTGAIDANGAFVATDVALEG